MPLERQVIELPFFSSLDTKTDAKQIPLGKLLVLQGAVIYTVGNNTVCSLSGITFDTR